MTLFVCLCIQHKLVRFPKRAKGGCALYAQLLVPNPTRYLNMAICEPTPCFPSQTQYRSPGMCDGIFPCHGVVVLDTVRSGMTIRSRHFVAGIAGSTCHAVRETKIVSWASLFRVHS